MSMSFNNSKIKRLFSVIIVLLMVFITFSVSFPSAAHAATTLKTYTTPSGVPLNTTFTVKVRVPGGTWLDLDEYQTRIGGPSRASFASFVNFDTNGPVEMSVTYNSGTMSTAKIRPSAKNITPSISGNTATFTISSPMKLVLDVNDNVDNDLMIFANPLETNVPSASDPDVIYYGPGYYSGNITVPSGKTLYLAGGAVVKGGIVADDVSNVTIRGRGILYQPDYKGISLDRSSGVTLEGIIVNGYGNYNNGGYGVELENASNVTIDNIKLMSYKKWTDGIDSMSSNNVSINDVYVRSGDDAIAIYGSREGWAIGSSSNFNITNSVLMNGLAHPINIGTHGNPNAPDRIDNLTFSNIDILTHNPLSAVGFISVTASDENLLTNVLFTDIRWEDVLVHKFIDIITYKNSGYSTAPGRGINGITIKNFSYNGTLTGTNQIYGNSSSRLTQNVYFENLQVNGSVITSASAGNFAIGNYTSNINFVPTGGAYNRIQSYNYQTRYVRHQNNVGRIDSSISPVADSQWKIVPGLADPTQVSFESINFPGYYLRNSNYNVVLNQNDGTNTFAQDATFRKVAGLADSTWTSFQSYNYPDRYLRHYNYVLYIQPISSTTDKEDATFKLVN
ncbi:Alpha-L-arabinofuranosidase B (ABFB) [compost metagenome]